MQKKVKVAKKVTECPITTADRHMATWAISYANGFIKYAPKRGWKRFLKDGYSISHAEWRIRYKMYMKSDAWRERRLGALKRADHKCTMCGSERRLQVHHAHYANVGLERIEDLRVVCIACHKTVHATWRTTPVPLDEGTRAVLRKRRIERAQLAEAQPFLDELQRRHEKKATRENIKAYLSGEAPAPAVRRVRRRPKPVEAAA